MFKVSLAILIAIVISVSCNTPSPKPKSLDNVDYYKHVQDFVHFVIHSGPDSLGFLLEDSVTQRTFPDGYEECLKDTSTFIAAERRQISAWTTHPAFAVWTTELVGDAHLIRTDTVRAIFSKSVRDGWNYFYQHVARDFNTLGCPLFLRNYTWCLCYTANYCGRLRAEGRLALYEKKGDQWVVVKTWGDWVS